MPYSRVADLIRGLMVVEKLVKRYLVFLGYCCDEIYHYPPELYLALLDNGLLIYLKIFENIRDSSCENSNQKLSPLSGDTAPYK